MLMIEIRDLQKVINGKVVLDIASMTVQRGKIAVLIGQFDSGKDVLMSLFTGRSRSTAGEIRLAGIDPFSDKSQFSRKVGVQFSSDNLYERLSPHANLKFYARLYRVSASRVNEVLEQVGLADHAHIRVEKLPANLKRRLSFGRAILHQPEVLLLEDPFSGCDEASIALLSRIMKQISSHGTTILILAESINNLSPVGEVIYQLDQGRIVATNTPQDESRPMLPFMIPARQEDKVVLINPSDILYITAQDERAFLQTIDDRLPTQFTMAELEKRLAHSGFFRAHRGYLVNLQQVKEIIPYTRDSFSLRLRDAANTEIPLSKSAAHELRELLGY